MADIQLITLDLDNTLWDVDRIIRRAEADLQAWLAENTPACAPLYTRDNLTAWRESAAAAHPDQVHDLSFMRTEVLARLMIAAGYGSREAHQHAQAAFDVFFAGRNRVEFFDGALEALEAIAARFTILALTNGNADIERAGLGEYLAGAISSADVGRSKPHPDMFHAPLRQFGLSPEQAIHVGDHPIDDIEGARAIGMHTVWVNLRDESAQGEPSREIQHLRELPDALADIAGGHV